MYKSWWTVVAFMVVVGLLASCGATPAPEVVEKEVLTEVRETVIVEQTAEAVEKEVTRVVEQEVTATAAPQAATGGTFDGSLFITITGIDPHKNTEFSDNTVLPLIVEGLVAMGADGEWKGVLAESWDVSDDGLTWTFHLREGVKFHNGRDMTADDVIYSFDRMMDENSGAVMYSVFKDKIASYQALDPHTVEFVLTGGPSTFLSEIGLSVRAAIIARECVTPDGTIVNPIGTGPFQFIWWRPGDEFRAARFDDYWGQVANIDEAVFHYIPDPTIRFTALQTGEIDWMRQIPDEQMLDLIDTPREDIDYALLYEARSRRLSFNVTRPPFDDVRMRKAVAYAIDKEEYNEVIWFGLGNPHNQPFVQGSFLELPVEDPYRISDLDQARALIAEAGYGDGVEVSVIAHEPLKTSWELFQAKLAQIGMTVNIEVLDSAQWTKRAQEGDYDMTITSVALVYHWDRVFSYFEEASTSNWVVGFYHNPEIDSRLVEARNTADQNRAKEIYTEILEILQEDVGNVFIAGTPDSQAWRTWVEGWEPNASNTNLVWPGGGLNYISLASKP